MINILNIKNQISKITFYSLFFTSYFLLLTSYFSPVYAQEEPEEAREVIGKFKGKIFEKKPPIQLRFDPFEGAAAYMKPGEYIYDKQLEINSNLASSPFPVLSSDQIVKPWLRKIVKDYIALFHPMYGYDVKTWKLTITDEKGTVIRTYESKGIPPKNIYWDGKEDDGSIMNPGITYFYSAEATDALGNLSRVIGRKIVVNGILGKEKGEWIITLRGDRIWKSENSTRILAPGEKLLQEAADIVKKKFTRKITVQVYSRNESLSRKRAKIIANWLLSHVVVPKYTITRYSGFTDEVYKSSYIKIIL